MDRRRALMARAQSAATTVHGTWEDLFRTITAGTHASEYTVGETISLTLDSSGGTYAMQIVGINTDTLEGSTNKAAVSLISTKCYKTKHRFNPAYSAGTLGTGALGGWKESELRSYLQNTVLPLIPSDVRSRIVSVKKYSKSYNASGTIVNNELTNDSIWVPSCREINIAAESSGPNYSSVFTGNSARIKYSYGTTTAVKYYQRTVSFANTSDFSAIATTGVTNNLAANSTSGYFPFGFCVN